MRTRYGKLSLLADVNSESVEFGLTFEEETFQENEF